MKTLQKITLIVLCFISFSNLKATTITIGTGTLVNTTTTYPAPYGNWFWGAKHQFLILASELTAAGMTAAGPINSLAFNVSQANGVALQGFTIAMKNTTATNLTFFETGLTTVFTPQNYTEIAGINTHVFATPFLWDGTSNIIVETCFNNNSFTNNAIVFYSTTSFTSSLYHFADNINVCGTSTLSGSSSNRPNMIFDWTAPNTPPTSNFTASPTFSCSGLINFTDLSTQNPTSWTWYFGDGNTSTQQNPSHTYLSNGSFSVSLVACNAFGCDSLFMNNLVTVNTSSPTPIAASCTPSTLTYCCGFGISNVTFNTINNNSNDGIDGYSDFTCQQTTVFEGATYNLSIGSVAQSTQNYGAWIDYNNDGVFNNTSERIFTATSQMNTSGNVIIPAGAVLNTPLRMRVSSDFDFSAAPTPCGDLDFGQAEDYTIIITQNPNPPIAAFTFSPNPSCSGTVCFTDQSQNVPTSWLWDFGDGVGTSLQQNPCYNFTADGVYNVTLTVTNANGTNFITQPVTITTANQVLAASCSPSTLAYCCGYGILNVVFNTITNSSPDAVEGYQDFSCAKQTTVTEGNIYPITITTGTNNPQDTRVWIDLNNDGAFTTNELVFDAPNAFNPSGNITIPLGAIFNTPLRMRISSDIVGTAQNGCTNNDFGQTEDYGIIILQNLIPPAANFSATPTTTCSDPVQFTDLSQNAPTSWLWYFGDGNTSTQQNPSHTYANSGTYTVSLVVSNVFGQDSLAKINFITIACQTNLPFTGTDTIADCNGTLFDDGGPFLPYSELSDGIMSIQPVGATQIILNFVSFDFEDGLDFLIIYDGPSTASPALGFYTGNTLPNQFISSGGAVTIQQLTTFTNFIPRQGFELNWSCTTVGIEENKINSNDFIIYPNPTSTVINIEKISQDNSSITEIQLFNIVGQSVYQSVIERDVKIITIDASSYPKGVYFATILTEKGTISKRILIQ